MIEAILGDYKAFFADLVGRLGKMGIDIKGRTIRHLLYRTGTMADYEAARDALKPFSTEFAETNFNGRPFSVFILKHPLELSDRYTVGVIEVPAPHPDHMYEPGLESFGVIVGNELPAFKERHAVVLTGTKDYGPHNPCAYITFDNQKTVKFFEGTIQETIAREGGRFEKLTEATNGNA